MMRTHIGLSLILACACALVAGEALADLDTVWMRTYGGPANEGLTQAIPASDGNIVAVGYTYSFGPNDVNVYVVKTDADGDTLWTRAIGGAGRDYGYAVCEAPDGGYVLVGFTTSEGAGKEDVYVAKLDAGGSTTWTRTYGGVGSDEGRALCRTTDGGFVVAGRTASYGSGQSDAYLLKLDADGDTVWTRVYGGAEYDWGQGVCETADGCYCMCGTSGSNSVSRDICLIKVDPSGTLVWQRYYGDFSHPFAHDWGVTVWAGADSGLVVTGNRIILQVDPSDIYFLKTDRLGTQLTLKRYADSYVEYGRSICETPEGGFIVCGAEKTESTLKNDLMLAKRVSGSGWLWRQLVGGSGSDWGNSIVQTSPGYYLIAGYTDSYGAGGYDGWLLKMREPEAGVGRGDFTPLAAFLAPPSPNPVVAHTTIAFGLDRGAPTEICIYDVAGRQVRLLAAAWYDAGEHAIAWDGKDDAGRDVCPGVYLARMSSGSLRAVNKMVVLRR